MKAKKLTARERRLSRETTSVSCESVGLDPAVYHAALRYLFDRPLPEKGGQEWYWDIDAPEFEATPLQWTHIQTVLFANAGNDLAPYSDDQVGMGLNHVMSNNAGDIPHMVNDPSVPLVDAMRMMRALNPATVPSRYDMKGKAASSKSTSLQIFCSTARLLGPATMEVDQWSVALVR